MEFHEKLQKLRKQKGMTQEELARVLYVSRAAVSKWESGRGYPGIDSLKEIAKYFSVTIDELLSGEELLNLAEEDHKKKEETVRNLVFGALDCSGAMLFFLPLFRQAAGERVESVSLLALTGTGAYLKYMYVFFAAVVAVWGILLLSWGNCQQQTRFRDPYRISLTIHAAAVLVLIAGMQPYAAAYLFLCLLLKGLISAKHP